MSVPARVAVQDTSPRVAARPHTITIALLGHGTIGAAVARAAADWSTPARALSVIGALVRDPSRADRAGSRVDFVADARVLLDRRPDVVVEALGGINPARVLVRAALERRIPVVTANKALMARHGDELLAIARRTRTPLRYEASVLAGVPFLGTFATRPYAARVTALTGIVNGTSNYVLSRMAHGASSAEAIAEAQRLGYAEPDPGDDLDGVDAAHKLAVLTRHFGLGAVPVDRLERTGIAALRADDFTAAAQLGGTIKPLVWARATRDGIEGFVGPALVPRTHKLARIDGVENALALDAGTGGLFLSGPGAGPAATATTILDDVIEAVDGRIPSAGTVATLLVPQAPATPWFVRLTAPGSARESEVAKLLGSHGVWPRNTAAVQGTHWFHTYESSRPRVERALAALEATGIHGTALRAIQD